VLTLIYPLICVCLWTFFCSDWRPTREGGNLNTWCYVLLWMVNFWEWVFHNCNLHF